MEGRDHEHDVRCPHCKSCQVLPWLTPMPGFQPYQTSDIGRMPTGWCLESEEAERTVWHCEDCDGYFHAEGESSTDEQQ